MKFPHHSLRRSPGLASILRNGSLMVGTQWVEAVLRGVYVLVIGRVLGPELYGIWSYALASYAFAMALTNYGLEALIPVRLGRDRDAPRFLGTTLLLRFALLGVVAVGFVGYALTVETDGASRAALLLVVPALIGRGAVLWSRSVLLGLERSGETFRLAVYLRLIEVVSGVLLLWSGAGLMPLLILHALTCVAEAVLAIRRIAGLAPFPIRLDTGELRPVLREGAVLGLASPSVAFLNATPVILARHLTDDMALVGQIGLALQLAQLAVMAAQGLLGAALPVLSRASERGDPRVQKFSLAVALGAVALFAPAIALAALIGPALVGAVLGAQFVPAGELLAPALLAAALMVMPNGYWQLLVVRKRRWSGVVAGWLGAALLVILTPALVARYGAAGTLGAASAAWTLRAAILIAWASVTTRDPGR